MLALEWGCTVAEAQERCDAFEFAEWKEFYRRRPWGEVRADWRIGNLCALLANIHRAKGASTFAARDFMMPDPDETERPTLEVLRAKLNWMAAMQNAYVSAQEKRKG